MQNNEGNSARRQLLLLVKGEACRNIVRVGGSFESEAVGCWFNLPNGHVANIQQTSCNSNKNISSGYKKESLSLNTY